MSLYELFSRLSNTSWSVTLREAPYPYVVLGTLHVLGIALFGGMVAIGNLRILGLAMRNVPVSQVIDQFRPWKWAGFVVVLVTGLLLTLSEPLDCYDSVCFWLSLLLLLFVAVNAWIFHFGIYRSVAAWDQAAIAPFRARLAAAISLALWTAIVFAGRGIAFT